MAQLLDLSSLTYLNAQEATESSQVVFEKVYTKPVLEEAHDIRTGIQMKTQIPFFGQFGLVGLKDPGSCDSNTASDYITPTDKVWDPQLISFRMPHCQADISQLFKLWKRSAQARNTWEDVDNNELMAFLQDRIADATLNMILRLTSFGDTAADVIANGGYLTAGTTKGYFTPFNGIWKQIYTAVAATSITKIDIDENAEASYAAQLALASDRAIKVFRKMFEDADSRMWSEGAMPSYQVTRSLWMNYIAYLEDKSLAFTLTRAEEGKTDRWQYRGIPIIVRDDWDRTIRAYEDNGTTYRLPHRAILTDIRNIPVGTSDESDFYNFDMFYDKKDKKHYTDVALYLDAKLLEEYAIQVAY